MIGDANLFILPCQPWLNYLSDRPNGTFRKGAVNVQIAKVPWTEEGIEVRGHFKSKIDGDKGGN